MIHWEKNLTTICDDTFWSIVVAIQEDDKNVIKSGSHSAGVMLTSKAIYAPLTE